MNKLQELIVATADAKLKASGAKINQVQRNALKEDALKALFAELQILESANIVRTNDGIVLEIPNDELGAVFLELDIKVKDLDFDIVSAVDERETALKDRADRAEKAAEKKAKVAAERKAKAE